MLFTEIVHRLGEQPRLTENHKSLPTSHLYSNQARAAQAVIDLEYRKTIFASTNKYNCITSNNIQVHTSAVILSGHGKTVTAGAIAQVSPPSTLISIHKSPLIDCKGFKPETISYQEHNNLTLVVIKPIAKSQWEKIIGNSSQIILTTQVNDNIRSKYWARVIYEIAIPPLHAAFSIFVGIYPEDKILRTNFNIDCTPNIDLPMIEYYIMDDNIISETAHVIAERLGVVARSTFDIYRKILSNRIGKIREGLQDKICQICMLPLTGKNIMLVRCCGLVLCDKCGVKGNQLTGLTGNRPHGRCAHCKHELNPRTDLIYIDKSYNVDNLLLGVNKLIIPTPSGKTNALINTINGILGIRAGLNLPYDGKLDNPSTDQRKILICGGQYVKKILDLYMIGYLSRINVNTIEQFRAGDLPLLINSTCAGLDLPFVTDIIFMDKVSLKTISQVQRIGRIYNLRVHLFYDAIQKIKVGRVS